VSGPLGATVPEPASIFLLFTVIVAGWRIYRGQRGSAFKRAS
jgi:hypothetical protein